MRVMRGLANLQLQCINPVSCNLSLPATPQKKEKGHRFDLSPSPGRVIFLFKLSIHRLKQNPIDVWEEMKAVYPKLYNLAKKYCHLLRTSVPSERLFSKAGAIATEKINRLKLSKIIPPFEPLQFPLPDELYEVMLQMMPNDHQIMEDCLRTNDCDSNSINRAEKSIYSSKTGGKYNCDGGGGSMDIMSSTNNANLHDSGLTCDLSAFETEDSLLMGAESDTDSVESALQEEDPKDPEWREPE